MLWKVGLASTEALAIQRYVALPGYSIVKEVKNTWCENLFLESPPPSVAC
jgi:hypothetical protein